VATDTAHAGTTQRVKVNLPKDEMTAMIVLPAPSAGEGSQTKDEVMAELARVNVTYGIIEAAIDSCIGTKQYNTPVIVAKGEPPKKGENATFTYAFDTENNHSPKEDKDGRIDYKDINFIQNAQEGQLLATKVPATQGEPGVTVTGKQIPPTPGKDTPFKVGANTKVSDDGLTLIAAANGVIVYRAGEVSIKDVMTISTDVDFNVGNLDCRGSLKIAGDIKAGFSVKANGDIEVNGNVEDGTVTAHGNIMVKGGFFGNGTGVMHADGNITIKFAEGQKLTAGGDITAGGEMINCNVTAAGNVVVKGKNGKIVGGEIRASKEIRACVLGSDAGTHTSLLVAYNADLMKQYFEAGKEIQRLNGDFTRIKEALYGLYRLQMDGKLTPEKKAALDKLQAFQKEIPQNLESLQRTRTEIEEKLKEYKDARIVADEILYPGVQAHFGLIYREIMEEVRKCQVTMEGSQILISDFRGH
jgi:uncharacterized protein (DUF342 family)